MGENCSVSSSVTHPRCLNECLHLIRSFCMLHVGSEMHFPPCYGRLPLGTNPGGKRTPWKIGVSPVAQ